MSAIVEIDEQNGAAENPVLTHNIGNSNMGSSDSSNLNPVENPIAAGGNSYEKWQLLHVIDMGTSSKINNIRVWRTGSLGTGAIHETNARTKGYIGAAPYLTPTSSVSLMANQDMPNDVPDSANLGIDGSLGGALTTPGYSDFLIHQIQTTPKALSGSVTSINYQYDETA